MVKKTKTSLKGAAYLVTATLLYGLIGVLSRTVGLTIPIFYQNVTRSLATVIILIGIVTVQHAWKRVTKRDLKIIVARSVAGVVAFLSYFYTILKVPFGTSYFIFYAGSVLAGYIFGHFWFGEHLTKLKIICLGLAILGLLLVYQVNASVISPLYFGLALFSGVTTAMWDTISKKISGSYSASYLTLWDESIGVGLYLIASLIVGEHWSVPGFTLAWAASFGIGIIFVATGMFVISGFKYIEAQIGSIIMLAEIVFAIIFGWLFYRESISLLTAIGGALIIAAIVLPEIYEADK